jgi:molybdopterin-guanine dinucleotide biosynthesis protein A
MENTHKTYLINTIESLKDKPMATILSSFSGAGISYKVQNKKPNVIEYWVDAYEIKGTITLIEKNKFMKKTELQIVREQNEIMATALRELIDYHHHIGNSDCSYSNNEIHNTLYKLAKNGLHDADYVSFREKEYVEPIFGFTSAQLLADIRIITDNYKHNLDNNPKNI